MRVGLVTVLSAVLFLLAVIYAHREIVLAFNRESFAKLSPASQAILKGLGREYLVEYTNTLARQTIEIQEEWKGKLGVEVLPFPTGPVAKATASEGVQAALMEWIERAKAAGLPAEEMAKFFAFQD